MTTRYSQYRPVGTGRLYRVVAPSTDSPPFTKGGCAVCVLHVD
jgi:hypothetical protein